MHVIRWSPRLGSAPRDLMSFQDEVNRLFDGFLSNVRTGEDGLLTPPVDVEETPEEFVVRADPQVILISDHAFPPIASRAGWDRIRAVRDGRVCLYDRAQGDVLVRPGPRMAQAAKIMVDCLQRRSGK